MLYDVEMVEVEARWLAAVEGAFERSLLVPTMMERLTLVWNFLRANNIANSGQNVVVYRFGEGAPQMTAGVQVSADFESEGDVVRAATPAGLVVTTAHIVPYEKISEANAAIVQWSQEKGYVLEGTSWEVYGHWDADPGKLRTDIFYLVQGGG